MLQAVQVQPHRRFARRHAVDVECTVLSEVYGEPIAFRIRDLSADGLFAVSDLLLDPGDEVVVEITLPKLGEPLCILGTVRRTETEPPDGYRPGMGVAFDHGDSMLRSILAGSLQHLPPPIPRSTPVEEEEMIWVECLLTWEEDLDDQINIWEVSDLIAAIDEEIEEALEGSVAASELLHSPARWPLSA